MYFVNSPELLFAGDIIITHRGISSAVEAAASASGAGCCSIPDMTSGTASNFNRLCFLSASTKECIADISYTTLTKEILERLQNAELRT